jgi:hypothetical protein
MTILKKNRNTKTYKMIKIQTITGTRKPKGLSRIAKIFLTIPLNYLALLYFSMFLQ